MGFLFGILKYCYIFALTNQLNYLVMKEIYCDICDQANVETLEIPTKETFYCCSMCRDNNEGREIKDNNFIKDCVIDYKN